MTSTLPSYSGALDTLRVSRSQRKHACALFDQQLWYFGCDARNPAQNLLLEYGFERHRPTRSGEGSSCYVLPLVDTDARLAIWAFGAFVGDLHEGVFVRRYRFVPRAAVTTVPVMNVCMVNELKTRSFRDAESAGAPRTRLHALCRTLGEYERWVIEVRGVEYRYGCLRQRSHLKQGVVTRPADVPAAWEKLAFEFVPASWQ